MRAWEHDEKVDVHVDSDWAAGPQRRSTSGGMMISATVVKHSRTQATRALSTAKAEYYAVETGAEALGIQSITTESNAAKAIASRRGFGKTRHVKLKFEWLQEVTKSGRVTTRRGEQSLSDCSTKGKEWREIDCFFRGAGGHMQVSQGNNRNEHRWKKWQGG